MKLCCRSTHILFKVRNLHGKELGSQMLLQLQYAYYIHSLEEIAAKFKW